LPQFIHLFILLKMGDTTQNISLTNISHSTITNTMISMTKEVTVPKTTNDMDRKLFMNVHLN
jgi:hypothetical protein